MKLLISLLAVAALAGCATKPDTQVLLDAHYVVRTAPDVLKTLPPLPPTLQNPKTATNSQVAEFINNTEEYVANLEAMVQTLVNFYEKPVTTAEAGTMQPVTPLATPTPTAGRVIRPQTTALPASAASAPTSRFANALQRLRGQ